VFKWVRPPLIAVMTFGFAGVARSLRSLRVITFPRERARARGWQAPLVGDDWPTGAQDLVILAQRMSQRGYASAVDVLEPPPLFKHLGLPFLLRLADDAAAGDRRPRRVDLDDETARAASALARSGSARIRRGEFRREHGKARQAGAETLGAIAEFSITTAISLPARAGGPRQTFVRQ
jgi:hypothetical protein